MWHVAVLYPGRIRCSTNITVRLDCVNPFGSAEPDGRSLIGSIADVLDVPT